MLLGTREKVAVGVEILDCIPSCCGFDDFQIHSHQIVDVHPAPGISPIAVIENLTTQPSNLLHEEGNECRMRLGQTFSLAVDVRRTHDGDVNLFAVLLHSVVQDRFSVAVKCIGREIPDLFK